MKIALISCTSKKQIYKCKASEMYSASPIFPFSYKYAKRTCDRIYILSAKYGLISEDEIIEPYNETLNDKREIERKKWSYEVLEELNKKHSLDEDEFLILAGKSYNKYLVENIKNFQLPLKGKSIGQWVPELRRLLEETPKKTIEKIEPSIQSKGNNYCYKIHQIFNEMKRMKWDEIDKIPYKNGIYIMFEKGERYFGMDRIVRVGTHNSDNRLLIRLKDHFIRENSDGSIFRKNIGLSILHQNNDPYEYVWGLNTSKVEIREENKAKIDLEYENFLEKEISKYLQNNISFVCFYVETEEERIRIEEGIISTLNKDEDFISSDKWLGLFNPKKMIVKSSLWNIKGLDAIPLSGNDIEKIKKSVKTNEESEGKLDDKKNNNWLLNKIKQIFKINYSLNDNLQDELIWDKIVKNLKEGSLDLKTLYQGLWFNAEYLNGEINIQKSKKLPSCSINQKRRIKEKEFNEVYAIYNDKSRKNSAAQNISQNTSYIKALIDYFNNY